jgi:hypothetical protein
MKAKSLGEAYRLITDMLKLRRRRSMRPKLIMMLYKKKPFQKMSGVM